LTPHIAGWLSFSLSKGDSSIGAHGGMTATNSPFSTVCSTAVAADVLVLEDPDADGCRRKPRIRQLLHALERHARQRGHVLIKVARQDVRCDWKARGLKSKHAMSAAIAERLPDLEMVLPAPRKVYRSEDARVQIFDAASLVLYACSSAAHSAKESRATGLMPSSGPGIRQVV
jgi:hypothetical protein